jgi:putative copper export protein
MKKFKFTAILAALPFLTFAHTGHGVMEGSSMIHYLMSPMHMIPTAIIIAGVAVYFWRKKRATSK